MHSMIRNVRASFVFSLFVVAAAGARCALAAEPLQASQAPSGDATPSDRALAPFQIEMLDVAFQAASAMPLVPHVKNRARAQQAVVEACLALDQPGRALQYADAIPNWRRGLGLAEVACYRIDHGQRADVQRQLDLALQIADQEQGDESQDWRRDRIRAKVAQAYFALGRNDDAVRLSAGIVDSEMGQIEVAKARTADVEAAEERMRAADRVAATGNFDQVRAVLEGCIELYDRFYASEELRSRLEQKIKTAGAKLPTAVRIDLVERMAEVTLAHGDRAKARGQVEEMQQLVDGARWTAEFEIPLIARIAKLRQRAGDEKTAKLAADSALAMFDSQRDEIVDVFRAGVLRSVAETYQVLGDGECALVIYARAVEAGVENPNSRPRADDLCATCCSMALHGVEPDAELQARLVAIRDALGEPW